MNVLIVCSGNAPGFDFQKHQAFIYDQVEAIKQQNEDIHFDYFFIDQKGVRGYLNCLKKLKVRLSEQPYDLVHAHVATSGLLANLQRQVPVITTFHGSDINLRLHRGLSMGVELLSDHTIYVSKGLRKKALLRRAGKSTVIPCGVDFEVFAPGPKEEARRILGLSSHKKYILFSSAFDIPVKNYSLARAALEAMGDSEVELLELKNYTRREVALLLCAVDAALMTSFSEGSPQFVKEALACNCPVVSTDVGDVRQWLSGVEGCYLTSYEPADVADKLKQVLNRTQPMEGRAAVQELDNRLIAQKVIGVYRAACSKRTNTFTTNSQEYAR